MLIFWQTPTLLNAQSCTPSGDQASYGSGNVWIGYVYSNTNLTGYVGYVNEGTSSNPNFDQNFGGTNVTYNTNGCSTTTESFSIRYKLTKIFAPGDYLITVGGDSGYRLSLDGGVTWIVNKWTAGSYVPASITVTISGSVNLVMEYYDNSGGNRVSFNISSLCIGTEDQLIYGTNNIWNGYVYEGTGFNSYKGLVQEGTSTDLNFDQSFGGDIATYPTSNCSIITENFSVRYRLRKHFAPSTYTFVLGADDGYRFSLDGGTNWVIDNWSGQTYNSTSYTATLNGTFDMVVEYVHNDNANRVNFSMVNNIVLSVNLINFTAKPAQDRNELEWTVAAGSDPDVFSIEKSTDGTRFTAIGSVQASFTSTYSFTDASISAPTMFYRLKSIDRSGVQTYSEILTIRRSDKAHARIKLFPTIVSGDRIFLEASLDLPEAVVIITDASGRRIKREVLGKINKGQRYPIELSPEKMPSGLYFAELVSRDQRQSVARFVVR